MSLVTGRTWVYPAQSDGRYRRARRAVGVLLILFLVGMPWVRVGGLPAVQFDLGHRRTILFGTVWTPHDTWALALIGLLAALGLFFFTSVLGRVWCGWACPQTVWLEWVFRPIERLIEGSSHRRKRLDQGPADLRFWGTKALKWVVFAALTALWTAAFLSWFVGGPQLLAGEVGTRTWLVGGGLFLLFYFDVLWFREQLCHYVCPYARFQGALMDRHSLVVAYDPLRGEPRRVGKRPSGGDCIDCRRCVEVCPSGIDIRNGDQLQCVACAACVDACDAVMIQIGKPKGLVRYTADRRVGGGADPERVFGRRSLVYLALLGVVGLCLVVALLRREPMEVAAIRARDGAIFRTLDDGTIVNHFRLHITNATAAPHRFLVKAQGDPEVRLTVPGLPLSIPWGEERRVEVFAAAPPTAFRGGRRAVQLVIQRDDGHEVQERISLLGPELAVDAAAAVETSPGPDKGERPIPSAPLEPS